MSTGGIFKLISNDGIQDKLLMATDFLEKRVKKMKIVIDERNAQFSKTKITSNNLNTQNSWAPVLKEIEKTHNIFVNSSFKPFVTMGYEYSKTQITEGSRQLGTTVGFTIPQFGDFFNDMVVHIRLKNLKAINPKDKVRYVSFPGHKIINKASFYIQNNPIDSYSSNEYNCFYNFHVPPGKKTGWLRNMGQEIPNLGYVTADPTVDEIREYRWFGDGAQTFKRSHDTLDLWIPILFWFKDIKHAVPNGIIPYGQTRLELKLAKVNELVSFANYEGDGSYTEPRVDVCDLYVNHVFMMPFIHDIFMKNFGFSLIRVHRRHITTLTKNEDSINLNELKWPIETMYIAFRPQENENLSQYWNKNSALTQTDIPVPVSDTTTVSINQVRIQKESPSVDTLELKAFDIRIFEETSASWYNSYIPYRFGCKINTPEDPGWYMMNFNLNPGDNDPSGHINVSKSREFYLSYRSSFINRNKPTDLIVLADALNFLYIKDGSAVLRFST